MFKLNNSTQMNMFDETLNLSDYHMKLLNKSWAGYFRENIFPKIDEEKFSVLYSDKASRPNTPVNIMVGLLVIKELTGLIDNELMEALIFDLRFKYALCTTSFDRQPISRNAFTNFRNSLLSYELETGIDLFTEETMRLSKEINACCETETTLKRMDSIMISSSCKHLSRIDLVYKVNVNLIETVNEIDGDLLSDREKEYLNVGFKKETVYSTTKENQEEKLKTLLKDSKDLYDRYKDNNKINILDEFKLLDRMLHEQIDDTTGLPKSSKEIKPNSLQNPSDPDATYRFKYGNNIGYVGNVVEEIHENGEIYITGFDVKQNTYSDALFMEDYINNKDDEESEKTLIDAAYYSSELEEKARAKNIELIPTQTMGKKQVNSTILSEFEVDDENHQVLTCPNKEVPTNSKYDEKSHIYLAHFDKSKCDECPCKEKCALAGFIKKKTVSVRFTNESLQKAKMEKKMNTKEYKSISNHRAGIEGTMSTLRRKYNVDKCPSRGLFYTKLKFAGAILSINIKKAIKYKKNRDKNADICLPFEKIFSFLRISNLKLSILC
ncbi:MAG: transposase [Malacoplasma sp.]|nr:transposase [Malacoplasma sp.]